MSLPQAIFAQPIRGMFVDNDQPHRLRIVVSLYFNIY